MTTENTTSLSSLHNSFENRRSIYALNSDLPVDNQAIVDLVEHAVLHTPSSFNSQSTRIVVLFGDEHKKVWDIAEKHLREAVGDGDFSSTEQKLNGFRAAAGTILFYEDDSVVKGLQEQFALYADKFPVWAEHSNAMHQYVIWTALRELGVGANLQHYNPLIDADVAAEFDIPSSWKLIAQMPFGGVASPAGDKEFQPASERMKVFGK